MLSASFSCNQMSVQSQGRAAGGCHHLTWVPVRCSTWGRRPALCIPAPGSSPDMVALLDMRRACRSMHSSTAGWWRVAD